ncbi:aminotransferase class IV [Porphyromonas crevioricanis]|uniref:Aminodeoxychorismate lyase n=2 Tax=Porphyromonas crevioricanis TaxID=393921 RepID=A0A2X4PKG2_9PORP|nr:aminodeoxychorismate lyase [Porphyromonas crevioricanis]GAD05674.1 aminodeoxychorismate lyase [Porphyromonas crevioricanis JCM 15906]GAD06560.1 aminodeoxychorismate lyase [Porphyromonas crevioricanis JCM 13913]SJZ60767.1 4-amino-4-deoxychorismate lyase [Porphyromonas crevioricanis]SQH72795.1 Uncharacterised protein [Porphyromonas crevioricanis]
MRLLLETIRLDNGQALSINFHLERMLRSIAPHPLPPLPNIESLCPPQLRHGRAKCRLIYTAQAVEEIQFSSYSPKTIRSLRIVEAPAGLNYRNKWADRSSLEALKDGCAEDEDILLCHNGLISDVSYANILLSTKKDPANFCYTPRLPLLVGTHLTRLNGQLQTRDISVDDLLRNYHSLTLLNAMLDIGEVQIQIDRIH